MRAIPEEVLILGAKRTPFGTFCGSLAHLSATKLGALAAEAAIAQSGAPREEFGHVVFGNVLQTSADAIYLARHIGLSAGLPIGAPALTVNRLCGSGFEALIQGAQLIMTGQVELCLAGGTESMSQAPHVARGLRQGLQLGQSAPLEDLLWSALTDTYTGLPMGMTAELLAERYALGRAEVDEYALLSQRRFAAAQAEGRLDAEITPVTLPASRKREPRLLSRDEHNRPETSLESLAKLPSNFKEGGVVHAGAASGIADGAGAFVLSSRAYAERRGLRPLGRILGWGHSGCEPREMGLGPVPATRALCERHQLPLTELSLFEVNEAFAPQYLAVERELRLDRARTNVDGGAIAVGHPLGASGARLAMHLLYELSRRGGGLGLGTACIGGGQGIALLLEAL